MAANIHISISAEPIFHIGSIAITNSIFTSWIVSALIIIIALYAHSQLKKTARPTGIQNFFEMIIEGFYNPTYSIAQSKAKTDFIFPVIMTAFLWILLNNWFGLLPGVGTIGILEGRVEEEEHTAILIPQVQAVTETNQEVDLVQPDVVVPPDETHEVQETAESEDPAEPAVAGEPGHEGPKFVPLFRAATADLNTTLALALFSVTATQIIGFKFLGAGYLKKYFNFKGPIDAYVGILEIISELVKVISFAFRLFGNIFAGEVLLAVIAFLVPVIAPIPFLGLEIFVGAIQALVFALLTLVFMSMATHSHEGEH